MMLPVHDPDILRREYASDESQRIRQEIHAQYGFPKIDFPLWVLEHVELQGDERVLDVGSGTGQYYPPMKKRWRHLRYYGMDLSPAMARKHPARGQVALANAQQLPFANASFDVVMANHMLYHVPDIDIAIEEFRRVLTQDGYLVAATYSAQTMPEFQALFRRALALLGATTRGQAQLMVPPHATFTLENGARRLARHFYAVVRYDLPTSLVFSSVDPVMTYLETMRGLQEHQLPTNIDWYDLMMVMRDQVGALLGHFGELVINQLSGVLIATDQGSFVRDFVQRTNGMRS